MKMMVIKRQKQYMRWQNLGMPLKQYPSSCLEDDDNQKAFAKTNGKPMAVPLRPLTPHRYCKEIFNLSQSITSGLHFSATPMCENKNNINKEIKWKQNQWNSGGS